MKNEIVKNLNVGFPVDLRDFIKPFGYSELRPIMRKFKSFIGGFSSVKIDGCFIGNQYVYNKQYRLTYNLTNDFAEMFAIHLDRNKGFEYVMMLKVQAEKAYQIQFENQRLKLESQTKLLEQKLADRPVKTEYRNMSSKVDRRSLHDIRREMLDMGYCDHWTETVTHHYFPVNDYGRDLGYTDIGKGKRKTINVNSGDK